MLMINHVGLSLAEVAFRGVKARAPGRGVGIYQCIFDRPFRDPRRALAAASPDGCRRQLRQSFIHLEAGGTDFEHS